MRDAKIGDIVKIFRAGSNCPRAMETAKLLGLKNHAYGEKLTGHKDRYEGFLFKIISKSNSHFGLENLTNGKQYVFVDTDGLIKVEIEEDFLKTEDVLI